MTSSSNVTFLNFNMINVDKYNQYKEMLFWGPPDFLKVESGPGEKSVRNIVYKVNLFRICSKLCSVVGVKLIKF